MQTASSPIQGICTKCGVEALILKGHLNKKHKKCRKGIWIEKPKLVIKEENE